MAAFNRIPSVYLLLTILLWCYKTTQIGEGKDGPSNFNILERSVGLKKILLQDSVARLEHLGKISDSENFLERTFLSPASIKAAITIQDWMVDAGLNTWIDEIGNVHGRIDGANSSAPALLMGSHLDTVIDAGKYDGALGIVSAIAAVKSLNNQGKLSRFPRPIEIIAFSDEEGVRFQSTFLGSAAISGSFSPKLLTNRDKSGLTMGEVLRQASFKGSEESLLNLKYDKDAIWAYIEVHIEQGPVLEFRQIPLGVVEGIAGQTRLKATMQGIQGHAGTVPMLMRRDPMPAAAEAIVGIEEICTRPSHNPKKGSCDVDSPPQLVCTVGEISSWPGASNVIPGQVVFTVDIRSSDDHRREQAVFDIENIIQRIARARGLASQIERKHEAKAVKCDPELMYRLRSAAISGLSRFSAIQVSDVPVLTSGAGHDAMEMARLAKVGMIFVRCTGGLSHSPDEHVLEDDVGAASSALLAFLEQELDLFDF